MSQTTTDVAAPLNISSGITDLELAQITDFQSALDLLNARNIVPESMADYGTGFEVVKDKSSLVGVPFIVLDWRFNTSDISSDSFVSAGIVTQDGRKLILNDGGTGIRAQLNLVTQTRITAEHPTPQAGLIVKNGLTRSDYTYTNDKGKPASATTFYLSES